MEMHFADVWEAIADTVPDAIAVVHGDRRFTWAAYEDRAARMAGAFASAGLTQDAKVGLFLYNGPEYLEAQFAAFKQRLSPINVNYRYLDDELRYLLDNADAEALVFHSSLGDRVARVVGYLPRLRLLVEVDDGAGAGQVDGAARYEDVLSAHEPAPHIARAEDDIYMLYTGGTTGMPKGVMYAVGGMTEGLITASYPAVGLAPPTTAGEIPDLVRGLHAAATAPIVIPACPLMHGTGMWLGAMLAHNAGGTTVTLTGRSFDAHELWATVARERVNVVTIVGDAFAKPMLAALDEASERGEPYDTSSLGFVVSSGVMFAAEGKDALIERIPQVVIVDAIGSTEGGMGVQLTAKGLPVQTARFAQLPTTKVFTDDGREVTPGSGEAGLVAAGGNVPLGYYKDEEKSARTFKVIDGKRYSFPGDWATVEADGSITLLGRGSQCINTAGEKVFPEEVEEAVKRYPGVYDCLVVGVPDDRFGERVAAVVSLAHGASVTADELMASCRTQLAAYKAPRQIVFVDDVPRAPNGKADYRTAKTLAAAN